MLSASTGRPLKPAIAAFSPIFVTTKAGSFPASAARFVGDPSVIDPSALSLQTDGKAPPARAQSPRAARKSLAADAPVPPGKYVSPVSNVALNCEMERAV